MRVLLLNPPSKNIVLRDYYCSTVSKAGYVWHPIDLLAQSAILSEGHDLFVLDAVATGMTPAMAERMIRGFGPHAVLALTSAGTWREDFIFLKRIKKESDFKLVLSGEIFLSDPGAILGDRPWIDGALLEFIGPDFGKFIEGNGGYKNLARHEGKEVLVDRTKARGEFSLGLPRHDLFPMGKYRMPWQMHHPFATVMTDYGCPFGCAFCNSRAFGYATRRIDDIEAELEWLHARGIRQLFIKDMTFAASRSHAVGVLETMIRRGWKFRWHCYSRADVIDGELAGLMARAGCHLVQMGVESADDELLDRHGKKIRGDTVRKAFRTLREAGVGAGAHFILGLPGDTLESMRRTVELAVELNPMYASFNIAMPRLGASLDHAGWMERPLDSSGDRPFYEIGGLDASDIMAERDRALRTFYVRPKYLLETLRSIKTPYQFINILSQAGGLAKRRLKNQNN